MSSWHGSTIKGSIQGVGGNMWKWLKAILTPEVAMKPEPLAVNATPSEREVRNRARCKRLRDAIAAGDTRVGLKDELIRRERTGR